LLARDLRSLFRHIQKTAHQKFGADETKSSVRYTTVSGFLFLRFFCPAVLTPKFFGLLNGLSPLFSLCLCLTTITTKIILTKIIIKKTTLMREPGGH